MGTIDQKDNDELFVLVRADSFFYGTIATAASDFNAGSIGDLKPFLTKHNHKAIKLWGDFPETFLIAPVYWDYYRKLNENPEVYFYHYADLSHQTALLGAPVPLAIHQLLAQQFPNLSWNFLGAHLIEMAFSMGRDDTFFSVFLWGNQFCLVYGTKGQIQLYNWIPIQGIEDVVYYLALALQSLQLKGTEVKLFINGLGNSDFSVLKRYFPQMVLNVEKTESSWLRRIFQWNNN